MQTKGGGQDGSDRCWITDETGKVYVEVSSESHDAWTQWLEGNFSGKGAFTSTYNESGQYMEMLSADKWNVFDPDEAGYDAGAVVMNEEGLPDGCWWITLYHVEELNCSGTEELPCDCFDCADQHGIDCPDTVKNIYVETPDRKWLLWTETTPRYNSTDADVWQCNIYNFHGEPLYIFSYSKGHEEYNNDADVIYFGYIFRGKMKLSEAFQPCKPYGFNVHNCLDKWGMPNEGLAVGTEIIHEYLGSKKGTTKRTREVKHG